MDELRARTQVLLDRPPVEPRPMADLRAGADQLRRRRRNRLRLAAGLVAVALLAVAVVTMEVDRATPSPTVRAVPVAPTTLTPSSATTPTSSDGAGTTSSFPPVLAFADQRVGWMAAGGGCSDGRCADPVLRHTTDGGRTWSGWPSAPPVSHVTFDAQTQRDLGGLVLFSFADPQDGWYGQGGQLWSTHDGGRSWHHLDLGGVLAVVPTGDTAWALWARCPTSANGLPAGQLSCPATLVRTPAALDAWTATDVATPAGGELLAEDGSLWLLAGGHLWQTAVGRAATIVTPPCAGEPGLSPNRLLDLGVGRIGVLCAAGAVDGATNTMTKVVVQSSDGGTHWTRFAVAPSTGWAGWAVGNGSGTALVVTDGHTLWRSLGGAWTPVFAPPLTVGELDQLAMIDASDGFVVADDSHGGYGVWATHDAGRTWVPVQLS